MQYSGKVSFYPAQSISIDISDLEHLDQLTLTLFGARWEDIAVHDGKVCCEEDISRHGSPQMVYTQTRKNADNVELFDAVSTIYRELKGWRK